MSFFDILSQITPRGVGYAILSLIIEKEEPLYIIVGDDNQKEVLEDLLREIYDTFESRKSSITTVKLRNFQVLTEKEYFLSWEDYAGKRLIFAIRDRNLKSPPLDKLALFIEEMWRVRSRDPIRRIANHVVDIFLAIDIGREHYAAIKELMKREQEETDPKQKKKLMKELDKKRKELLGMLERRFVTRKEDIDLTYELMQFLSDHGLI